MTVISGYKMKQLRSAEKYAACEIVRRRPQLLDACRQNEWREHSIWAYCLLRQDLAKIRAAIASATVTNAPNWSPAARRRRGWE